MLTELGNSASVEFQTVSFNMISMCGHRYHCYKYIARERVAKVMREKVKREKGR